MDTALQGTLLAIYVQLHDHVREAGKKRDQVIAFYLLVLVALFGAWEKIASIRGFLLTAAWIAGLFSFAIVMLYRRWHVVHGAAMVTLQRLMVDTEALTLERCKQLWDQTNDSEPSILALWNPMRGVESGMTWLFALLTLLPGYLMLVESHFALLMLRSHVRAFAFNAVIYVPVLAAISAAYVKPFHRFQQDIWAFRWLRSSASPTVA